MTAKRYLLVIEPTSRGTLDFEAMHEAGEPMPEPHSSVDYVEVAA